jgi:hypothetical protein
MPTITIPLEIPSQNVTSQGRDWRMRALQTKKRRTAWRIHAQAEMMRQRIPRATGQRALHVVAYRRRRCSDIANLIGGAKACVDGLVDAGLLTDDRDTAARITYEQRLASEHASKRPCAVLTITDLNPAGPAGIPRTQP